MWKTHLLQPVIDVAITSGNAKISSYSFVYLHLASRATNCIQILHTNMDSSFWQSAAVVRGIIFGASFAICCNSYAKYFISQSQTLELFSI